MSRQNYVRSILPLVLLAACAGEEAGDALMPQAQQAGLAPKPKSRAQPASAAGSRANTRERAVDLSAFVPADAFVWLQLESIDALDGAVRALMDVAEQDAGGMWNIDMLLGQAAMMMPGADPKQIDRKRPMGIAFSLAADNPQGQPLPTFVVPVRDPQRFAATLTPMPGCAPPVVENGYVGFSMAPDYGLESAPGAFATNMPEAQVVLRVNLARVVPAFRPMIDMGLAQARSGIETMPADEEYAALGSAVASSYLDGAGSFLESAEVFELAFSLADKSLRFDLAVSMQEGSPLASFGSAEPTDFARLASFLNEDSAFSAVAGFDAVQLQERFGGLFESLAELAPAGSAPPESLQTMWDFLSLYGSAVAVDADFEPGNLRAAYYADPQDHDAFFAGFENLAQRLGELSQGALALDGPVDTRIDDVRLVQYRLSAGEASTDEAREFQRAMALMSGSGSEDGAFGLMVTLAATSDHIATILAAQGDAGDAFTDLALARLAVAGGAPSGALGEAVESLRNASPAFAYSWDMARLFRQSMELARLSGEFEGAAEFGASPEIPEGLSVPVTSFFGIEGRDWRGGFFVNVEDMMALMNSIDG